MKTVTVKIPDELSLKLRKRATERKEGFSETIRRAISRELESEVDFTTLAAPYKGMIRGPRDLSSREGYERSDSR